MGSGCGRSPGVGAGDVLGVEAPLWGETTRTMADVEYLAFPRLIGIAEIGWSPARGRSWAEYRQRLGAQGPLLDAAGRALLPLARGALAVTVSADRSVTREL